MDRASILALLVLLGYAAFEVNAVRRSQHLFEPLHIFDQFVSMARANERCGRPGADARERFRQNLEAVTRRARQDLADANPDRPPGEIERKLADRRRAREQAIDALTEEAGCDDARVWEWVKLYELRARLTVR